jgi:hypothetical protein
MYHLPDFDLRSDKFAPLVKIRPMIRCTIPLTSPICFSKSNSFERGSASASCSVELFSVPVDEEEAAESRMAVVSDEVEYREGSRDFIMLVRELIESL